MARAVNKVELINNANHEYQRLLELINSYERSSLISDFYLSKANGKEYHWQRDKNLKDVLIHLYEWHQLLINFVENNEAGRKQAFLIEGYNWKNYHFMNEELRNKHLNTAYDEALSLFMDSHQQVMKIVENYNYEQLFTKGYYQWVGSTSLGSYFISSTSSHYVWAIKKVKKLVQVNIV